MDRAKLDAIIALVSEQLASAGYECIEAEWVSNERVLRLYVDQKDTAGPGITLDQCVRASKQLDESNVLDDLMPGAYTLEVSSPGVERPLRKERDFERYVGQMVEVKLADKVQERKHGKGRLIQVEPGVASGRDAQITLETSRGPWSFPLASLQRASLVYDWDAP